MENLASRDYLDALIDKQSICQTISLAIILRYVQYKFQQLNNGGAAILQIVQTTPELSLSDSFLILSSMRFLFEQSKFLNTGIISEEYPDQSQTIKVKRKHKQSELGADHQKTKGIEKSVLSIDGIVEEFWHTETLLNDKYGKTDSIQKKEIRTVYYGTTEFEICIDSLRDAIPQLLKCMKLARQHLPSQHQKIWEEWIMYEQYTTAPIAMHSIEPTLSYFNMPNVEPPMDYKTFFGFFGEMGIAINEHQKKLGRMDILPDGYCNKRALFKSSAAGAPDSALYITLDSWTL